MTSHTPGALLIHPPVYDFALYDLFLKPFGLQRIAAALTGGGYRVDLVNALDYTDPETAGILGLPRRRADGTGKFFRAPLPLPDALSAHISRPFMRRYGRYGILADVLKRRIARTRPDIIFIGTGMTYWYPGAAEAAALVREIHPGVPVVCGGTYASLLPDHCADQTGAMVHDGPLSTKELNTILTGYGLPEIPGCGPLPPASEHPLTSGSAAILRLNEGCPYSCEYCSSKSLSPEFIQGDAGNAFDGFAELYRLGVRNFAFYDDALLIRKETVLQPFLRKVIDAGSTASFYTPNAVHLRQIDAETAELMQRAGFREVRLGYESSSEDFHNSYGRKYTPGSFAATVEILKESGFAPREIGVYILAGLPRQHRSEVEASVEECIQAGVKIYIAEFSPVPGSALWETCISESSLPLAEEPLLQNNTFFPMAWSGFSPEHMHRIKQKVKTWNAGLLSG